MQISSDPYLLKQYHSFLLLEKSLSPNTIAGYESDLEKFLSFIAEEHISYKEVAMSHLQQFLIQLHEIGLSEKSQARIISGIKSFYRFLLIEKKIETDPTELLELPKLGKKLPEVLTVEEINKIISAIDLSAPEGHRNKAILETLYGCGLRVSELVNLSISNLYFDNEFIKVEGKGRKQRLVPISPVAIKEINNYFTKTRNHQLPKKDDEDILFLNRRGGRLTRNMIFIIIKQLAETAQINKNISPHTFRHSFATHLLEGGANLRVIQQMLGHESILTTEIYTHIDMTYLRDTILTYHPRNHRK